LTSIPGASWFGRHGERPGIIPSAVAVGTTLIYAAMKIVMAIEDKLGLPGFPAPAASYANRPDIAHSEWMLVGMAFLAAGVAFIMIVPWGVHIPRWLLASAVWIAGISLAAGAIRMTLRALRIFPDLGAGPQGISTWLVLLVLDAGAVAWIITAIHATRYGHPASTTIEPHD